MILKNLVFLRFRVVLDGLERSRRPVATFPPIQVHRPNRETGNPRKTQENKRKPRKTKENQGQFQDISGKFPGNFPGKFPGQISGKIPGKFPDISRTFPGKFKKFLQDICKMVYVRTGII